MFKQNSYSILLENPELRDVFCAKEEQNGQRDEHGRFLKAYSKRKNVNIPIVSEYLRKNGWLPPQWPENHQFAACLTHDIDIIYPTWKYAIFTTSKFITRFQFNTAMARLRGRKKHVTSKNPYWNFKEIMKLESKYGGQSTFYFKTAISDPIGWSYNIQDLEAELNTISEMGGEVGLHGGYYSYLNPTVLRIEKQSLEKVLGKKVVGVRMHYLRFDVPKSWSILSNLDFKYDTTFGFPDEPGFRNGMCDPFVPYDVEKRGAINILEIPLTIMDSSLFSLPITQAWDIVEKLVSITEKNHGVITILWHNNNFDEIFRNEWAKMYERILILLKNKNAWMTTGESVYNYWTRNA